ncbi:stalk domain-containing protein [Paenibacillus campi]|uniref:stalk domain-containing protein n=1 Tax=Paenibacillus campi TaxID=3106031 RepID=UPI002AFDCE51|nr:stalk domain-containing protein [Paenibacillus sp. SGZ-1014]
MKASKYTILLCFCLCFSLLLPVRITAAQDNTAHALKSIVYIQASLSNAYAIDKQGTTWTWGGSGQYAGTGDNYIHFSPLSFPDPSIVFTSIAPGAGVYSSAVTNKGLVYTWGVDDPSGLKTTAPVQVPGLTDIVFTATGTDHFLALDNSGQVWGWGGNNAGQLDKLKIANTPVFNKPVRLSGLDQVKAIASYDNYSVALKKDGTLWGWGSADDWVTAPVQLQGGDHIVSIQMSYKEIIATNEQGKILYWYLSSGNPKPTVYTLTSSVISVDNGSRGFIYAVTSDHKLWKIDPTTTPPAITQVVGLNDVTQVVSGNAFTLALDNTGIVHSFGINDAGQLGIGNPFMKGTNTPVIVQKAIVVQLNGQQPRLPNAPILVNNAVYVPVRGLFEKMNATVVWNRKNKNDVAITSGSTSILLTKGKNIAIVNGKEVPLSAPPLYANESIFIPLRFISETIGAHVDWDRASYTVQIHTKAATTSE